MSEMTSLHQLKSHLDGDSLRRIRIDLMELHARLGAVSEVEDEEVDRGKDRISAAALREKTLSLLTALRNL